MRNLIVLGFMFFLVAGVTSLASADEMTDSLNAAETALENALGGNENSLARTESSYVSGVTSLATLSSDKTHLIETGALSLASGSVIAFLGSGIATVATVAMENNYMVLVTIENDPNLGMEIATIVTTVK